MRSLLFLLIVFSPIILAAQETFLYEITLYDQFKHKAMWSKKQHAIQKRHIAYLEALTKSGKLQLAGIVDQGLDRHTGFIILTTKSFREAKAIALNDPAVKEGMMAVVIRPLQIYFSAPQSP